MPGRIARVERLEDVGRFPVADVDQVELDPESIAHAVQGGQPAGVLEAVGGDGQVARLPIDAPGGDVHRLRRGMGQGHVPDIGADDRRDRGAGLLHPLEDVVEGVGRASAEAQLPVGQLGHRRGGLGRQRAAGARVEVDPGRGRGQGLAQGRDLLGLVGKRAHHGPYDMGAWLTTRDPSSLRPPSWLTANLGRPDLRVIDVRWRPDGTGRAVYGAGHIPGASYLDWVVELSDRDDETGILTLADPERVGAAMSRSGVESNSTVVLYDDVASLYAGRTWWSLRASGVESVAILDGGFRSWTDRAGEIAGAGPANASSRFEAVARPELRVTTADVRDLLGSAVRPAGRRAGHGRVPRLRGQHPAPRPHPGCREPAGRRPDPARHAACSSLPTGCAMPCSRRMSLAAAGSCATTARAWPRPSSRSS